MCQFEFQGRPRPRSSTRDIRKSMPSKIDLQYITRRSVKYEDEMEERSL